MDYENLLQKYPTSSYAKTQRSSSVNQNSQKQESTQQIKPQALLKIGRNPPIETIITQPREIQKKKNTQHKGEYTERISDKKNVQKLLDNQNGRPIYKILLLRKGKKSAYPNLMSLQPSTQNLFDIFSQDSNSRNPTTTARSKRVKVLQKGRANSIMEGYNLNERDKGTLIKLNQQLQIQNNHLNEQLKFEQSQNTKLSLQMISMNDQITLLTKYYLYLFRVIKRELETSRVSRQGE